LSAAQLQFLTPDWPVAKRVKACVTTRQGGFSKPPYDAMNLASHVGDDPQAVEKNRQLLGRKLVLPEMPRWLEQVHGTVVADTGCGQNCQADAFYSNEAGVVCAVLTADCLPVFFSNRHGTEVAVAHAGWKGLAQGVIEKTIEHFHSSPQDLSVWLGPAIGPNQFEVGNDVVDTFMAKAGVTANLVEDAFRPQADGKWLADIYALARSRLGTMGVSDISGGNYCTVSDSKMFYSYRRDGKTGRMASLIWIEQETGA